MRVLDGVVDVSMSHEANVSAGVWRELEDAKRGSQGEGHRRAVRSTSKLYTEWKVERLKLSIGENAQHLEITDWMD